MANGAILLARTIQESEIWQKPDTWLKLWIYVLINVNFKDTGAFERGEGLFLWERVKTDNPYITKDIWHKFTEFLVGSGQATKRKTTRGLKIKVLNYSKYQDFNTYTGETKDETATKQRRNYNSNKGNKGNKYIYAGPRIGNYTPEVLN